MLNLEIVEDGNAENILKSMENTMVIIQSTAKSNTGTLFKGYMAGAVISRQIDRVMVEIQLITATIKFDKKRSSSSFQKKELKYAEILSEIVAEDGGNCTYLDDRIKSEAIELPVIRYKESTWEFARRLASRYWLPLIPDETADKPVFSLGIKTEGSAPESGFFKKEHRNFVQVGDFMGRKLKDITGNPTVEDYTGMELRSYYNYKIGMSASYGGKSGIICAKRAEMEQSEVVFTYVIGTQELYAPEPTYHKHLHGRCMTGTVVKCENETVKLQLDIDEESGKIKSEAELYPFPWKPETGNLLYCMPEKDTVVSLYIGGPNEGEAIVINTLRKKNEKDTDKPENRYLTTIDHKRLYMKKKEIGFSLEDKDEGKTHFILQDDKGITFKTKGAITVQAKGRIQINGKTITTEAKKVINLLQGSAQIGMRSKKVSITGTSVHLMPGVATPELAEAAYQQELKDMQAKEAEIKSKDAMASGVLAGSGDGAIKSSPQSGDEANPSVRKIDPPIDVGDFNINKKFSDDPELKEEYIRQLKGQEEGLNKLTVAEYLKNRQAYKERLEEQKNSGKKNPTGRSPVAAQAQEVARSKAYKDKVDELMENEDLSENEAQERTTEWLKTQAALHDPDQIAGGNPENITGMGNARVNSSIGSQWKSRADDVETQVKNYLETNNIPEDEWDSIYLNINMPYKIS